MSELNWNEALKGWKVTFSIGHRPSDRWEVYTPKGCGGVVAVDSVTDWTVRELLDRMSAAPIAEPSSWTGDGLPPVGTVCEYMNGSGRWHQVRITGHGELGICFRAIGRESENYVHRDCAFRPIRTPEQIAEEEREKAIEEMAALMKEARYSVLSTEISPYEMAKAYADRLYQAGYRKAGDA